MAGTTDTVPAMLTPGEFVIKQESAAMLGEPLLRKLNAVSDNATQGFHIGGGVSENNRPHSNIDALIGQAQLANMVGNVIPGYQDGDVVAPTEQALPDWGKIRPNSFMRLFSDKYRNVFPSELGQSIEERDYAVDDSLEATGLNWMSDEFDIEKAKAMKGVTFGDYEDISSFLQDMYKKKRKNKLTDTEKEEVGLSINALTPAIKRLFSQNPDIFKSAPDPAFDNRTIASDDYDARQFSPDTPRWDDYNLRLKKAFSAVLPDSYENGGGVGEAGRQYPPGTLMSPFMGDTVSPQDATATTPFQSPEQAAEFERMIKMLQIQEILKKAKESQTYDAEMIESDGKSILPPWQGKRNFKGNLYEDNIEFPVSREGYLQR